MGSELRKNRFSVTMRSFWILCSYSTFTMQKTMLSVLVYNKIYKWWNDL